MKNKFIIALIISISALSLLSTALADDISVKVNGTLINADVPAMVINDRTVVPVRAVAEALNCDIEWDDTNKGVNIYRNNSLYMMWLEHNTAFKISPTSIENYYDMDTPPVVINDRTMLPLRALGELLGAQVNWDQQTLTASVDLDLGTLEENTGYAQNLMEYEKAMFSMYDAYNDYVHGTSNTVEAQIILNDGRMIKLELYPDIAPQTTSNFISLAQSGFYKGLTFHRVIKDFMIQGGGYDEYGVQKSAQSISGEFLANGYFNLITHDEGVISMARTQYDFDSASSQFFITHQKSHSLDGDYAAFGKVTDGMDVVDEIASVTTDANDKPLDNIVIEDIIIIE